MNVVVAVIILMWDCKVQVVQWQKGIVSSQGLCSGCTVNVMVAVMICVRLQGTRSPIFMVSFRSGRFLKMCRWILR